MDKTWKSGEGKLRGKRENKEEIRKRRKNKKGLKNKQFTRRNETKINPRKRGRVLFWNKHLAIFEDLIDCRLGCFFSKKKRNEIKDCWENKNLPNRKNSIEM